MRVVVGDERVDDHAPTRPSSAPRRSRRRRCRFRPAGAIGGARRRPTPRWRTRRRRKLASRRKRTECGHLGVYEFTVQRVQVARRAVASCRARRPSRLVLRRALRHHAVRLDGEPCRTKVSLQHDFRSVLERVGHDAGVTRLDDVPCSGPGSGTRACPASADRLVHDEAVQLKPLAVPRAGIGHDFVDVLVVLGARPAASNRAGRRRPASARPRSPRS